MVHFSQMVLSDKFRQYDYGPEKNLAIYNATEPPNYKLENINVPLILFYADNDWLSNIVVRECNQIEYLSCTIEVICIETDPWMRKFLPRLFLFLTEWKKL